MTLNEDDLRDKINRISEDTNSDIVFINCSEEDYLEYKKIHNYEYEQPNEGYKYYNKYKDIVKDKEYFRKVGLNGICVIFIKDQ